MIKIITVLKAFFYKFAIFKKQFMSKFFKQLFLKTLFFLSVIIIPVIAFSWGVTGHRVVSEIAKNHLTNKSKREIKKIIGNESISSWANWPDFIKSDTTHIWDHTSTWHYVNLPSNLSKEEFIAALQQLPPENLYSQIIAMKNQLADKTLSIEQRRTALIFLIHLIGDLHQPLHVGRGEDLGGNRIKINWFDKSTNLHSLWDNALVDFQQYSYTEYASILDIADKNQITAWQNSSLEDWFYETYQLANKVYASVPTDLKFGYKYNFEFKKDLDNQLLKGGYRLAKVLNDALK